MSKNERTIRSSANDHFELIYVESSAHFLINVSIENIHRAVHLMKTGLPAHGTARRTSIIDFTFMSAAAAVLPSRAYNSAHNGNLHANVP